MFLLLQKTAIKSSDNLFNNYVIIDWNTLLKKLELYLYDQQTVQKFPQNKNHIFNFKKYTIINSLYSLFMESVYRLFFIIIQFN